MSTRQAKLFSGSALAAVLMTCVNLAAEPVKAAEAAPTVDTTEATDAPNGDIVVTARKRAEDILKIPVAVTAFTSADIQARNIVSITDLAAYTPGLNIDSNSSGRNDRSFQQIILRGFTPSSQTATPTTSLFIDGVPVASATALETIDDPERVEIIKGPQSAYFGRNTFAGAVNVVTKTPSDVWGGAFSGLLGTRFNYDFHGDIEGPIVADKLSVRLSARHFSKDGSYANVADPEHRLGDQSTTSATLTVVAHPTERLTLKAFALVTEDKDGPSAQGLISAFGVTNPAGATVVANQSNCVLPGLTSGLPGVGKPRPQPFICGITPSLSIYSPAQNDLTDGFITSFLANPKGRLVEPSDGVQGYGLKRLYYHAHLNVDYEVGETGVTLTSLTGINREYFSELADLDNYDTRSLPNNGFGPPPAGARQYFDFPFLVERNNNDFSQELRFNYDQHGRFRLTGGASYLDSYVQGGLGGGNGALGVSTFSAVSGATKSRTTGAFFGAGYDLTHQITLNLEGRYQIDTLIAYAQPGGLTLPNSTFAPAGFYAAGSKLLQATYRNFLPRAIIQFNATPNTMVYASYSKGVNPGQFNTTFLTQSAALQQAAANAGIGIGVRPEKLDNYEIGLKGKFFDNRLRLAASIYYAQWKDQINTVLVNALDGTGTIQAVSGSVNAGRLDLKGIEADAAIVPFEHLTLNLSGAINDSDIKSFVGPSISAYTGIFDFRGKENPNTSKYSGVAGVEYRIPLARMHNSDVFARGDFIYKSGTFADQANLVRTPDSKRVNVRAGFDLDNLSFEGFVTNVFNDRTYTSIAVNGVFTPTFGIAGTGNALIVGLPDLRTFGIRARYRY